LHQNEVETIEHNVLIQLNLQTPARWTFSVSLTLATPHSAALSLKEEQLSMAALHFLYAGPFTVAETFCSRPSLCSFSAMDLPLC
jgi:hypothetical protein